MFLVERSTLNSLRAVGWLKYLWYRSFKLDNGKYFTVSGIWNCYYIHVNYYVIDDKALACLNKLTCLESGKKHI